MRSNTINKEIAPTDNITPSVLFIMRHINKYDVFIVDNIDELVQSKDRETIIYDKLAARKVHLVDDATAIAKASLDFCKTGTGVYLFAGDVKFMLNKNNYSFELIASENLYTNTR